MKKVSSIEWTGPTWNPTTGCSKISPECLNCYAEKSALYFQKLFNEGDGRYRAYKDGFKVGCHPHRLKQPYGWEPSLVFVNSMSDLFHHEIPLEYIQQVYEGP